MKFGTEYGLYYSLSFAVSRLSVIGLATSTSPEGRLADKGLAVTSANIIQYNRTNKCDGPYPTCFGEMLPISMQN